MIFSPFCLVSTALDDAHRCIYVHIHNGPDGICKFFFRASLFAIIDRCGRQNLVPADMKFKTLLFLGDVVDLTLGGRGQELLGSQPR